MVMKIKQVNQSKMKDSSKTKLQRSIRYDDRRLQIQQKKKSLPSSLRFIRYQKHKKQTTIQSQFTDAFQHHKPEEIVNNISKQQLFPVISKNKELNNLQIKTAVRQLCQRVLNGNKSIKQSTCLQKNDQRLKLPFFKQLYQSDISQRTEGTNINDRSRNANQYNSVKTSSNQRIKILKQLQQRKANFSQRFVTFKQKIDKLDKFKLSSDDIEQYSKSNRVNCLSKPQLSASLENSIKDQKQQNFALIDRYQSTHQLSQPDDEEILKITKLKSKNIFQKPEKPSIISNSSRTLNQQLNLRLKRSLDTQQKRCKKRNLQNTTTSKIQQTDLSLISPSLLQIMDLNLKNVKAKNFIMLQHQSNQMVIGHKQNYSLQIASLTKIMTFYVVIKIAQRQSISLSSETYIVDEGIEGYSGTSAQLCNGENYTIRDLLYGLMLPSGNDAAMCLARWGGSKLNGQSNKQKKQLFIKEMNEMAGQLGLKKTKFCNPHGLPHSQSKSTVEDIAKLCSICMKISLFQEIVRTKKYKIMIENTNSHKRYEKIWENTNKLLRRNNFIGIKTGITITAGPCLASAYKFKNKTYIVVLARANKVSRRFKQTRYLLYVCLKNLYKEKITYQQEKDLESLYQDNRKLDSDYSDQEGQFNYHDKSPKQYRNRANIITYET